MAKAKPTKMFETVVTVRGRGDFPIDMLRYDACFPKTAEDASAISGEGLGGILNERIVKLIRRSPSDGPPTAGRWSSFGWTVLDVEVMV